MKKSLFGGISFAAYFPQVLPYGAPWTPLATHSPSRQYHNRTQRAGGPPELRYLQGTPGQDMPAPAPKKDMPGTVAPCERLCACGLSGRAGAPSPVV